MGLLFAGPVPALGGTAAAPRLHPGLEIEGKHPGEMRLDASLRLPRYCSAVLLSKSAPGAEGILIWAWCPLDI